LNAFLTDRLLTLQFLPLANYYVMVSTCTSKVPQFPHVHPSIPTEANLRTKIVRNLVVGAIASQPSAVKRWLFRHPRVLLTVLFRLERNDLVVSPAGPPGYRFQMKLQWQGNTAYVLGAYEEEFVQALRLHIHPGDACMDVGAHLGYYCLTMARMVGPSGRVISFEPIRENLAVLEENVALNNPANVELVNVALGDRPGVASLLGSESETITSTPSTRGYAVKGPRSSVEVRVDTLDAFLKREGHRPSVIKIDVEGAELDVLKGSRETLKTVRPVVLLKIHGSGDSTTREVSDFFTAVSYSVSKLGARGHETFCLATPN
jgi:FkbM family methyltransferase